MREEFLYYIWENRLTDKDLKTSEGEAVEETLSGEGNSDGEMESASPEPSAKEQKEISEAVVSMSIEESAGEGAADQIAAALTKAQDELGIEIAANDGSSDA